VTEAEWQEWTRRHKVCWELKPLIDLHEGKKLQVGFEFNLFAQFPPEVKGPEERRKTFPEIHARLAELCHQVFPSEGTVARFELAPLESAVRLRPETEFAPELQRTVRVFHKQEYFQGVAGDSRERLAPLEGRLRALGLKAGAWGRG
jgi:uncharacterized protein YecE (DUF72 family)